MEEGGPPDRPAPPPHRARRQWVSRRALGAVALAIVVTVALAALVGVGDRSAKVYTARSIGPMLPGRGGAGTHGRDRPSGAHKVMVPAAACLLTALHHHRCRVPTGTRWRDRPP